MHKTHKPQASWWKGKARLGALLAPLVLATGCQTNAGTGMLAGGGLGAVAGGLIGAATHHPEAGALIGAAAGATAGGLAGAAVDNHEQKVAIQQNAQRAALGIQDVATLTRNGTPDDIIMNQIRTSGVIYHLRSEDILYLQQNGVHPCVIETMQATAALPPPPPPGAVIVGDPPPVVIYREPPPVIGVGFGYRRGW
jgi:outer membrane protein with glycine zipper